MNDSEPNRPDLVASATFSHISSASESLMKQSHLPDLLEAVG